MSKKRTIEEVREIANSRNFELVSKEYLNNAHKLILKDKIGYFYVITFDHLKSGTNPSKFNTHNPFTIDNIKLFCKINKKPFKLLSNIYINNRKYLQWKCTKEDCGEEFESSLEAIEMGNGCPFCVGKKVGISNCLATKRHDLALQWHSTKNGNLTPYDVTCGSGKEVWWKCKEGHEWKTMICIRSNCGCPYCSHNLPSDNYNLLVDNPQLCEEWNFDKNDKSPEEYLPRSNKKVWWICSECGNEWKASIDKRNGTGRGCPECNKSYGEKKCKNIFMSNKFIEINQEDYKRLLNIDKYNNIYFIPQKTFDDLIGLGNGLLSYDFYIPKYNLLIEYQGEFHDGTAGNQTEEEYKIQQEHDKRKKEYALSNGYNFLEIWYWDFDNIEKILMDYLKELKNTFCFFKKEVI